MTKKSLRALSKVVVYLLIQVVLPTVSAYAEKQLTQKQAEELLLNIPDAIAAKAKRGCPSLHLLWPDEKQATLVFSMHNPCDKSGSVSDKIGNYTIDLNNGEVWSGVDRYDDGRNLIDSQRMKELRRKFFRTKK